MISCLLLAQGWHRERDIERSCCHTHPTFTSVRRNGGNVSAARRGIFCRPEHEAEHACGHTCTFGRNGLNEISISLLLRGGKVRAVCETSFEIKPARKFG